MYRYIYVNNEEFDLWSNSLYINVKGKHILTKIGFSERANLP